MANTPLMYKGTEIVFDGPGTPATAPDVNFWRNDAPGKLLSEKYPNELLEKTWKDMMKTGQGWVSGTPYHKGDLVRVDPKMIYMGRDGVREVPPGITGKRADMVIVDDPYNDSARNLRPAEYRWHEVSAGIGMPASECGRTQISAQEALNMGLDIRKLVRVSPDSEFYYKPPKEYPVAKAVRAKKVKEVEYNTVGVRFLDGQNLAKVYTYRVPKKAKLHLGQEVIVPTDKNGSGYITQSVAVVVRFDKEKQDTFGYDYTLITGTIKPL